MHIRPVLEFDISQITEIYGLSVREETASFELEPPGHNAMLDRMRGITSAGYPYLVAVHGDVVLGYAYASAFRPRPAYRTTVEDTVYVARHAQKQGVGRALLLELIAICKASGFKQMVGGIGGVGNLGSIRLHEVCGFEKAGHFKSVGYKHDAWHDVIFMQREL